MTVLKSPSAHKNTGIEARCAATGMRMTEQRRVIARVLADSVRYTVEIEILSSTSTQRR